MPDNEELEVDQPAGAITNISKDFLVTTLVTAETSADTQRVSETMLASPASVVSSGRTG